MALEQRDYGGGAVDTTITASINSTDLSISIASSTGWPSGGANGPFHVIVDYDVAGREKIEIASRTGTTLTVADVGKRGVDGTSAASHASGATIRHCFTAQDANEANDAVVNTIGRVTTKGDLIVATGANVFARRAVGVNGLPLVADSAQATGVNYAALSSTGLAADSVGSSQIAANAVGASELADNAVDTAAIANLAVTGAKIANDTITSTQLATNAVDSDAITALAVTAAKLANASLTDGIAALASGIRLPFVQAAAPGSPTAGMVWFNTTKRTLLIRNAANTGWEVLTNLGPWVEYTPVLTNFTVGASGLNYARYTRHGSTVLVNGFFKMAAGATTSASLFKIGLPPNAPAADLRGTYSDEFFGHAGARATDVSSGGAYAAVGVIGSGTATYDPTNISFIATAGATGWNNTNPFTWEGPTGDRASWFAEYETSTLTDTNFS